MQITLWLCPRKHLLKQDVYQVCVHCTLIPLTVGSLRGPQNIRTVFPADLFCRRQWLQNNHHQGCVGKDSEISGAGGPPTPGPSQRRCILLPGLQPLTKDFCAESPDFACAEDLFGELVMWVRSLHVTSSNC